MKDTPRIRLASEDPEIERKLINVLLAIAYVNPTIGYYQGMSYLISTLFAVIKDEEQVFWAFLGMMKTFDLDRILTPGFLEIGLREYQCTRQFKTALPDLQHHFRVSEVENEYYLTK